MLSLRYRAYIFSLVFRSRNQCGNFFYQNLITNVDISIIFTYLTLIFKKSYTKYSCHLMPSQTTATSK